MDFLSSKIFFFIQEYFHEKLPVRKLGFLNLMELIGALNDVLRIECREGENDWLIFDIDSQSLPDGEWKFQGHRTSRKMGPLTQSYRFLIKYLNICNVINKNAHLHPYSVDALFPITKEPVLNYGFYMPLNCFQKIGLVTVLFLCSWHTICCVCVCNGKLQHAT